MEDVLKKDLNNYDFPESLVADALHHYTMTHCYGELDEDFYYDLCVQTFFNDALETCIVLDYLEHVYGDFFDAVPLAKQFERRSKNGNSDK